MLGSLEACTPFQLQVICVRCLPLLPHLCCLQYEREAAVRGGGAFVAPAQRVTDFLAGQAPKGPLPASSSRCAPAPLLLLLVAGTGIASPASRPSSACPALLKAGPAYWISTLLLYCPSLPVPPASSPAGRA